MKSIFEFKNYQSYLLYFFQLKRGNQARLAESIQCRSSFLTQVIDEKVDLSLDQAMQIPNFLGLTKTEKMAFILYVNKEKVSELTEKKFIEEQIAGLKEKYNSVKERMKNADELSEDSKAVYYSSWIYGAIHILCAFSWINSEEDIVKYLKTDYALTREVVQFLLDCKLIQKTGNKLSIGKAQIHLGEESAYIANHHINWRLKSIEELNKRKTRLLNFSSLIGISKKDAAKIKDILLTAIAETDKVVQLSGEEAPYLINIDFMEI